MLVEPGSSTSSGVVADFLRLLDCFLFDMPSGFHRNLNSGMNGICSAYSATTVSGGTNATISSIIGVIEGVSMPDYSTVLVLEIKMTIFCEKSPRLL